MFIRCRPEPKAKDDKLLPSSQSTGFCVNPAVIRGFFRGSSVETNSARGNALMNAEER
jgi:hypothetical protein